MLAVWENGFRHITNNKRPIVKPADLQGIKLRVPEGKWRVKMFQAYGANPSPMKFSELFTALQTGVMDGEENPLTQIYSAKFQEVQKYLSLTGHVYTPAYLTVGTQNWATLPPDVRKTLEDTAKETQAYVYSRPRKDDDDLLDKLKAAGMQVNEVDKDAFIAASKPIYEEFGKEVPGAQGADRPRGRARQVACEAGARRDAAFARFRRAYGVRARWLVGALMVILFVEVTVGVLFRSSGIRSSGTTSSPRCCSPGSRSTARRWRRSSARTSASRARRALPPRARRRRSHASARSRHRVLRAAGVASALRSRPSSPATRW